MARLQRSIYPTDELYNLLSVIHRYGYIRTSYLYELLDGGLYGLRKQITNRKKQGFISTPKQQFLGFNSHYCFHILQNTERGKEMLYNMNEVRNRELPDTATRIPIFEPAKESREFAHSMMVSDTIASIEIGIKKAEGYSFINWCEIIARATADNPLSIPYEFTYDNQHKKGEIIGDGLFGIKRPDNKASFFILEAERMSPKEPKSLSRSSTLRKLLAYNDIITKQTYKQTGATNLRVLFVFPTQRRAEEACKMAERVIGETNRFLFTSIPTHFQFMKAPPPFPDLIEEKWLRPGKESVTLIQ